MDTLNIILLIISIVSLIALIVTTILLVEIKNKNIPNNPNNNDELEKENEIKTSSTKERFNPDLIDLSNFKYSDDPISLQDFIALINKKAQDKNINKLAANTLKKWLSKNKFIVKKNFKVTITVNKYCVSEEGKNIGIIEMLEEYKDTGEMLPSFLISKQGQEYLLSNLNEICTSSRRKKERNEGDNVGSKWTKEEEDRLIDEFNNQKLTISEIAKLHGRKYGGISSRLKKLGLIEYKKRFN